ncbi:rhomboid family intramembrane serine protease [Lysinimonas soli]|uniref:Rhomboid family intramembrane serine protease n=1 Tax=Lysinimonas soli TaxID=1074233 RepID=A0ABW0NPI0_9MICO
MSPAAPAELDPSVCYRHPDRTSWTLCERCGRTICPECQILTPSGVRCPDCVRELGGTVQWTPAGGPSRAEAAAAKTRRTRERARRTERRPRWQQAVLRVLRPGDAIPLVSWLIAATVVVVGVVGLFSPLPVDLLAASPQWSWQVWRFVTGAAVSGGALNLILSVLFFLLIAPTSERELGRRKFLIVFFAAVIAGNAFAVLAGITGFGLFGGLYGLFGSTLIIVWPSPAARTQLLITIAVNFIIAIALSPSLLPEIVGGLIAGAGAGYLMHRFEDTPRLERRAYLIIAGGLLALIALAVLRSVLL